MNIKIWEVTNSDNVKTELINNVSNVKIEPITDIYFHNEFGDIKGLESFKITYEQNNQTHSKEISENAIFKIKENELEIEIHDY